MENQQFGDEHGLGLNDAGVESVEVIKGPASLYGSDALGGVLYFNLRNLQMRIPLKRT
jgi:iron complex outermembrane receptor protein